MRYSISSRIFLPVHLRASRARHPSQTGQRRLGRGAHRGRPRSHLVTAGDGHAATVTALRGATDILAIGASTEGRAASKAGPDLYALHGETYLETSDAHARGPSAFTSRNPFAWVAPKGPWSSTPPPRATPRRWPRTSKRSASETRRCSDA